MVGKFSQVRSRSYFRAEGGAHVVSFVLCVGMALGVLGGLFADSAVAQDEVSTPMQERLRTGVEAFQQQQYNESVRSLGAVFRRRPAFVSEEGSAAYWLGRAYLAAEEPKLALSVWRRGLGALQTGDGFDARLADVYVRSVFALRREDEYTRAAETYLELLRHFGHGAGESGAALPASLERVRQEHLAQLAPLLPEDLRGKAFEEGKASGESDRELRREWTLRPGGGERLVRWWRAQDPLPATPRNERLEEHLGRVLHARQAFSCRSCTAGYDGRGEVYVRYGSPPRRKKLRFDAQELRRSLVRSNLASLSESSFPEGEAWHYPPLGTDAFFLFVEEGGTYRRTDTTLDFVPATVRTTAGPGAVSDPESPSAGIDRNPPTAERAYEASTVLLKTLRGLYGDLAALHPSYAGALSEVNIRLNTATASTPTTSLSNRLYVQVANVTNSIQDEETRTARHREEQVPRQQTNALDDAAPLPVAVRRARFLEEDGTTRTEVYWSMPARGLALSESGERTQRSAGVPDLYLMQVSAARYDTDYNLQAVRHGRFRIPAGRKHADGMLAPQRIVFEEADEPFSLGLQWEEYPAAKSEQDTTMQRGPLAKRATARFDSLVPLSNKAGTLEMSDLVPTLADPSSAPPTLYGEGEGLPVEPYPFQGLRPEATLALYFEIYHLNYGADDRTHYTVEHEIRREEEEGGGLLSFLGSDEERRTAVKSDYSGTQRRTQEYFELGLSDWSGSGTLQVTVRVTDETTGEAVERDLSFDLRAEEGRAEESRR